MVASIEQENSVKTVMEFTATDDIVSQIVQTTTADLSKMDDATKEVVNQSVAKYAELLKSIEGVTYTTSIEGDKIIEVTNYDLTKADLKTLVENELLSVDANVEKISISQSEDLLQKNGWTIEQSAK